MTDFVHLHCHSEFSLLDGLASAKDLCEVTAKHGMNALALTDHGVMFGAVEFYRAAQAANIKPIIGSELYVARNSRLDRKGGERGAGAYHLTALAQSETGYKNLLQLASKAQLEGFYYKPRVDKEILAQFSEGLIVTTGCPSAEVPRLLMDGKHDEAYQVAQWYREVFGKHNYYVEIQNHPIDFLPDLTRNLVELSRKLDIPLVATNDVHYARATDAHAHEVLLCIQTQTTMKDPNRMRIGETFYLRTPDEMAALFPELPDALKNTVLVAEMCDFKMKFGEYHLPLFPLPDGFTAETYLRHLCEEGLKQRYGERANDPIVRSRLEHELSIIHQMGFDAYFLIVWDLCRFARTQNIWYNARGSAAGSIVAYTLFITLVDPIHHGLIFERFLNPGRLEMPDIDLDFPDDRREQLINYTIHKYGSDKVAQIITFGTLGARAALRDTGRALDIPLPEVDRIAKLVPAVPGKPVTIADVLTEDHEFFNREFKELYEADPQVKTLIDTAKSLEGVSRHASTHAAGVVITDRPIVEYCPLHRATKGDAENSPAVTQFPMQIVTEIGLLKVDFLGLATLTVMQRAAILIEKTRGRSYNLATIPTDDPDAFKLLASGAVQGVFQVEGPGMRRILQDMKPTRLEHIIALVALYRPGPLEYIPNYIRRMHGEEKIVYKHPLLEPILQETYGIFVYQEQLMRTAMDMAGYTATDADKLRKAVAKKKKDDLLKQREKFVGGGVKKGLDERLLNEIFDDFEAFARYGFPKGHAADYAVVTVQTAYLKAKYPVEYITALLSVSCGDTEKAGGYVGDAVTLGIKILPPNINQSQQDFVMEDLPASEVKGKIKHNQGVRFGLAAVKNVGEGPVQVIIDGRGSKPFTSLDDFARRVDLRQVNRRALECLIKAGAFDEFGNRNQLLNVIDALMSLSSEHHRAQDVGQMSLFGALTPAAGGGGGGLGVSTLALPKAEPPNGKEMLSWEKDLLGCFLGEHPLHRLANTLESKVSHLLADLEPGLKGSVVVIAGMINSVRIRQTKKGDPFAFITIEDLGGQVDVTLFPRVYEGVKHLLTTDTLVMVRGKVDVYNDKANVLADEVREHSFDAIANVEPVPLAELDLSQAEGVDDFFLYPAPSLDEDANAPRIFTPPIAPAGVGQSAENGANGSGATPAPNGAGQTSKSVGDHAPMPRRAVQSPVSVSTIAPPSPATATPAATAPTAGVNAAAAGEPDLGADLIYHVEVILPRSGQVEDDIRRLGEVHKLLTSYSGHDSFSIIVPRGGARVAIDFPNDTTKYNKLLHKTLERMLGDHSVRIVNKTPPDPREKWRKQAGT